MKRLKIMKSYLVLWLFIYFLVHSNIEAISVFFFATLTFNLAVLTLLTIGIIMVMKAAINLVMLAGTFGILAYKKENLAFYLRDIDKIMPANIAHMFNARAEKGMLLFTSEESRDVIEWIEEKFSHQNRYTNYFIGTVLMIGLLGTFSGLLVAIDDMGRIILSLSGDIDLAKVISDFSGPLGGMAVGFGSSLFGVIAAIILGLMGYILNKNQEVLIEGVEDWLKGRIIDSGGASTTSTGMEVSDMPDHKASFMEVFIDNISTLSNEMSKMSQTNERLNSATIASIQAARDEHEISVELFEDISASLKNIDKNAQNSTKIAHEQFDALQTNINTNSAQLIASQKESISHLIEKMELALEMTQNAITQKFQSISEFSSNELKEKGDEIAVLLKALDLQLGEKQTLLTSMKQDTLQNQEINEALLQQLVSLFKDSSAKLDVEHETLQNIFKELEFENKNSELHFNSISDSLSTLSSTLKNEVDTLTSLEAIQKEQSSTIKETEKTAQNIRQTLQETQIESIKQEAHLSAITSKIDAFKEVMNEANEKSLALMQTGMQPLEEILEIGKNQDQTIKEILSANETYANKQDAQLGTINSELEAVNEQLAQANEVSTQINTARAQEFQTLVEAQTKEQETLDKILTHGEQNSATQNQHLNSITSELETIEKILTTEEQNSATQNQHLNSITSELETLNEQMAQANETSKQILDETSSEFHTLVETEDKQQETLDKLLKTDRHNSNVLNQIQKNTTKLRGASSKKKKSDGFFDKLFK